jgi:hypothetical protein
VTTHLTDHFQIGVPDFATAPWHSTLTEAFDKIDAILYGILEAAGASLWANNTVYVLGNMVQDATTGTMYMCLVGHTSSIAPATFSDDRTANPTYWQAVVE